MGVETYRLSVHSILVQDLGGLSTKAAEIEGFMGIMV